MLIHNLIHNNAFRYEYQIASLNDYTMLSVEQEDIETSE